MSGDALQSEIEGLRANISDLEAQLEQYQQREALLQRTEQLLHATLDSIADGVLAVDESGHVIVSNRQFEKMWRIPPDLMESGDDNEILHFVLDQLLNPEEFAAKVRELYDSYLPSQDTLYFHDGRIFLRFSLPLVVGDKLCGRVWTFRDAGRRDVAKAKPRNA